MRSKFAWTSFGLFYPADIFKFHSFGCHLGFRLGFLLQKRDPDRCDRNSHKSRLCFFTQETFLIFIPLAVAWGSNLDSCCRSVILASAIKMHINVVCVFYPTDVFHFHSFGCYLGFQLGSLRQKCDPSRCEQNSHESPLCSFAQQTFPIFLPLAVTWGPNLDPCGKSVILAGAIKIYIKVVYVFLPSRHFPFSYLWLSLGVPTWILAAKVCSWQVLSTNS